MLLSGQGCSCFDKLVLTQFYGVAWGRWGRLTGGREFQLVWLNGKYIIYLPGQKRVIFGRVDGVSTTLNFAFMYIFRHFFYFECARLPVTI